MGARLPGAGSSAASTVSEGKLLVTDAYRHSEEAQAPLLFSWQEGSHTRRLTVETAWL